LFCFRFSSLPLLCSVFIFLFFHNDERMKERNPSDPLLSALFFPLVVSSFFFRLSVACLSLVSLLSFLPRSVTVFKFVPPPPPEDQRKTPSLHAADLPRFCRSLLDKTNPPFFSSSASSLFAAEFPVSSPPLLLFSSLFFSSLF
jgi:hypothetical protein